MCKLWGMNVKDEQEEEGRSEKKMY